MVASLIDRVTHTQATIDAFLYRPFAWGSADCAHLAGSHVERFGVQTALGEVGKYATERGAKRKLRSLGVTSMEELADAAGFERIPPASALVGDLVGFPGGQEGDEWTALGVHVGGDRIMGFADPDGAGARCEYGPVSICTVAWRVA